MNMLFKTIIEVPYHTMKNNTNSIEINNKIRDSFKEHLIENNFYLPSINVINENIFEMIPNPTSLYRVGVVLEYSGRERTKDDDLTEQIEFNIKLNE